MQTLFLFAVFAVIFCLMVPPLWRVARGLVLACAMLVLAIMPAAAQTVGDVVAEATPLVLQILSIVLMAVLTWAAAWAKAKFGIDVQARQREALHSAFMTGARLAATRQMTGEAAVALILDYVRQSVPDALASLKPSNVVLKDLAESKLQAAVAEGLGRLIR